MYGWYCHEASFLDASGNGQIINPEQASKPFPEGSKGKFSTAACLLTWSQAMLGPFTAPFSLCSPTWSLLMLRN
jgi:hypothetical protein